MEKKQKREKAQEPEKKRTVFLPGSEAVYFSDVVRVRTGELGFTLSFCTQDHEDQNKYNCSFQVFLPPKVAGSLTTILLSHIAQYMEKYKMRITPEALHIEGVKSPRKGASR